jgi:PAS domain S-box-containing protein
MGDGDRIADCAVDSIIAFGLAGDITFTNPAASDLLGYSAAELAAMTYDQLLPGDGLAPFAAVREQILFEEQVEPIQTARIGKSGERVTVSVQYSPIRDDSGRIVGVSSVMRRLSQPQRVADRAQALLETAPDAMVIVNQHGQIVLVNAQTEAMFGYAKSALIGRDVELLIPEGAVGNHREHRARYMRQPRARNMGQGMELLGRKADGSTFPVEISLSPLHTEEGVFVSAAIRDITERKKAELKFRALLDGAPDAMVIVGESGAIHLVNAQTENIFGYRKDELIGQPVEMLIPERFRGRHTGHRDDYFSFPVSRPMGAGLELAGRHKTGSEFPVEISLSPLDTEEGMLVSAAIRDITDRKRAERALAAYNDRLESKNRELQQFAYIASHDLQEPLRTVTNFVGLLESDYRGQLDEHADKCLGFISQAATRMSHLITGLLEYSRIGQNQDAVDIDCNELLQNVVDDLSSMITATSAELVAGDLPAIRGYRTELRQLLQNLVTNAIKFRCEGKAPRIEITAERLAGDWLFSVADNGIGIASEHLERIFVIFQRLHTRSEYEGTGIGLAHVKKIVELHGGRIWAESKPGHGTIFYFTIAGELP